MGEGRGSRSPRPSSMSRSHPHPPTAAVTVTEARFAPYKSRGAVRPSVSQCHSTFLPTQTDGRSVERSAGRPRQKALRLCVRAQGGLPRAGTQTPAPLPRPTANGRTTSDGPAAEAARIGLRHSTRRRQQSRVETGRYGVAWLLMQQAVKLPPPSDAPFLPVSNFRPKEPARSHT